MPTARQLSFRPIFAAALVAGAMVGALATAKPAAALSIELKDVAPDRIDRQRAAADGLVLPGTPDAALWHQRLKAAGVEIGAPILIRVFKAQSELEVWMLKGQSYVRFATYPICHWSGTIGPKLFEGDRQTPEGFYTITRQQLHHVGRWPRSLNIGYPNAFDRSLARSGSHILIHGGCSSIGCFAMTNGVIAEVYALASAAVRSGQSHVPVHVFPFRMTLENLERVKDSAWIDFWRNLKEGHDAFERTSRPPRVTVCEGRYLFTEIDPSEVGAPNPLEPCGPAAASIANLDQLSPLALRQMRLLLNPQAFVKVSLPPDLVAPKPRDVALRVASSTPVIQRPACFQGRASCRRYVALQNRVFGRKFAAHRKLRTAGGRPGRLR